jgi:hypothetical protein
MVSMAARGSVLLVAPLLLWAAADLPLDHEAINYAKAPASDPVTRLQRDLAAGKLALKHEPSHGYLASLLRALDIPRESQMLVFSKTSFQASRINPVTPRAIYFNDTVAIGYVNGGDVLEIASWDPRQGPIFYSLDQDPGAAPSFIRRDYACLQCHQNTATSGVPGLLIRSVYTEPSGMPYFQAGGFVTDHRSPLKERWGGWFVTGTHGAQVHMGNSFARDRANPSALDTSAAFNRESLPSTVRAGSVLTPHSDIAALMVAEHQFRAMNLITRLNFETRLATYQRDLMSSLLGSPSKESSDSAARRIRRAADELGGYLFFTDEAPLSAPIRSSSGFPEIFEARGPRTKDGRSLRQFDLQTRLFRYPLSYLVYSEAFASLPPEALDAVAARIARELKDPARRPILEILRETRAALPPALARSLPD